MKELALSPRSRPVAVHTCDCGEVLVHPTLTGLEIWWDHHRDHGGSSMRLVRAADIAPLAKEPPHAT